MNFELIEATPFLLQNKQSMKRLAETPFFVLVTLVLLSTTGCTKQSEINYIDNTYELTQGIVEYYGKLNENGSGYSCDVALFSDEVNFVPGDRFSGFGSKIAFEMYSLTETELADGTYLFDLNRTQKALTFESCEIMLEYNFVNEEGIFIDIIGGTVQIEKKKDEYKINASCTTSNSKIIEISFYGELEAYNRVN